MDTCINHPDRKAVVQCLKHRVFLCDACQKCKDPEVYCKFRTSCTIWFREKKMKDF